MIYLKAPDEETFNQALVDLGWKWDTEYEVLVDEDGVETTTNNVIREAGTSFYTQDHSLDVIGLIYEGTGETDTFTDDQGEEIEIPRLTTVEGWHANLLMHSGEDGGEVPAELADFVVDAPATPYRKFA